MTEYSSVPRDGADGGISARADEEFKVHDASSEISAELRELRLTAKLPSLDTSGSIRSEVLSAADVLALLGLDKYKNVILLAERVAAEGAQSKLHAPHERTNDSFAASGYEATRVNRQSDERPAVSRGAPSALQTWRLRRVQEYIRVRISGAIRLSDLASAAGLTRMHFAAQFRARTGVRPHEYVTRQRIARAQVLLVVTEAKIADVGSCLGFSNQAHFTTVFRRYTGTTPHRWRLAQTPVHWASSAKASLRKSAHLSESQRAPRACGESAD
jgi:AraC-like DNA-binding protein